MAAIEAGKVHRYVSDFPNPTTVGKKGVIVTPHLGASTIESEDNCAVMAVKELRNFLENGTIKNSVIIRRATRVSASRSPVSRSATAT